MPHSRKKTRIALSGSDASGCAEVNKHLRPPAQQIPPERQQDFRAACTDHVAKISMDQAVVRENGSGGGSLNADWEVGEHAALGIGKGASNQVERRQCNDRIAETAQPVDQDPLDPFSHGTILRSCAKRGKRQRDQSSPARDLC